METVIKLRPEELTDAFFQKLKVIAQEVNRVEIRLKGSDAANNLPDDEIDARLNGLSQGNVTTFTMDEFEAYVHKLAGE